MSVVDILTDLVRIPSENTPPDGSEIRCQQYVANRLCALGAETRVYELHEVADLERHPLFWKGRRYRNRPNVAALIRGAGGGRSLLLSGHIDTVPRGSAPWKHDPFGAEIENGRLYGRGALDMKAGIAAQLYVAERLKQEKIRLKGDLLLESVVDEEFGGVNGTLAGRLSGHNADAAIIGEPSGLRICPAQRGGRLAHITFRAAGDIFGDGQSTGAIEQLQRFLAELPRFAQARACDAREHPMYSHLQDRAPVSVTAISTAPWGTGEPIAVPQVCRVELYWQSAPAESQEAVENAFFEWLHSVFPDPPEVEFPIRWLPGSAIGASEPLVETLAACARAVIGREPLVQGIEAPCDMYVFHEFGISAVLWGPAGANAHAPDEYVELESLDAAAEVLLRFVYAWCEETE